MKTNDHESNSKNTATTTSHHQPKEKIMRTSKTKTTASKSTDVASSTGSVFLTAPPDVVTPSPPQGFEPPAGAGANFRGILPRGTEEASLATSLKDLARFASTYTSVLGTTAPPLDHVVDGLTVAGGWTTLRVASAAWDAYCATEEGLAWQALRPLLDKLTTAFNLAADTDKSLLSEYPGLATLLGSRSVIAQKAATTRRLNRKAVSEGKPATHGVVGKRRLRAAEKAALASSSGAASSGGAIGAAQPASATSQPVASPATPATSAANGGTHSP